MSIEELQKKIASLNATLKSEFVSPYSMSKIVNELLEIDLPPQMFYNYVKKNMIVSSKSETNKIMISKQEVLKFIEKYALRNLVSVS